MVRGSGSWASGPRDLNNSMGLGIFGESGLRALGVWGFRDFGVFRFRLFGFRV